MFTVIAGLTRNLINVYEILNQVQNDNENFRRYCLQPVGDLKL